MNRAALALVATLLIAMPAFAVDHNNVDTGRPTRFDDAESIAYRERAVEIGLSPFLPRRRAIGLDLQAEFLYGFALNSHLDIGMAPSIGGRAGPRETRFDVGDVTVGVFHNFNREHGRTPAFAIRADVAGPTGRGSQAADFRVRGIISKNVGQYDRLHFNIDLNASPSARTSERQFAPGLTIGYTKPLGYPRKFTVTGLAELSVQSTAVRGAGPLVSAGLGLRQQVGMRSVFDVGLQADLVNTRGAPRERIRFVAGYSVGF